MLYDFLEWFINDFVNDFVNDAIQKAWLVVKVVLLLWVAILLLPVWVLPFIYWFFVKRRER